MLGALVGTCEGTGLAVGAAAGVGAQAAARPSNSDRISRRGTNWVRDAFMASSSVTSKVGSDGPLPPVYNFMLDARHEAEMMPR